MVVVALCPVMENPLDTMSTYHDVGNAVQVKHLKFIMYLFLISTTSFGGSMNQYYKIFPAMVPNN